jgi:archaemetzincin
MENMIALVPIGEIDSKVLEFLKTSLTERFKEEVVVESRIESPASAYNPKRNQYHATPIVRLISDSISGYNKVLGVIAFDLWVPGLNFVFGEAEGIGGGACIISLIRLRQEFYGLPPDTSLFYERALKEAVHELGHLYGLLHCGNPRCVMHFSNSLRDTDYKGSDFCRNCVRKLRSQE